MQRRSQGAEHTTANETIGGADGLGHGRQDKQRKTKKRERLPKATCPKATCRPPHVSVALGEINICTRGWSSGTLDSLHQRTQAGNTELYFSSIVDLEYKQAMPCVMHSIVFMFLYGCTAISLNPKRAEECPQIPNAAKQHENERLDLIALAHVFLLFLHCCTRSFLLLQ
jgi:hypothetical protein